MLTVYGIKNCDTVKKTFAWLQQHQLEAVLHDYRQHGIDHQFLQHVTEIFGWENLVNKRSTTWRNLDEQTKNNINSHNVIELLLQQPTLIKRPIVLGKQIQLIGFNEKQYAAAFGVTK
ncbi:ArsC family reductase [Gallibacterium trehalosifermentans]|uniref:ArsC family reductase n=1 Tax=Gallibacterium trehalosifermentans TaxID=516935 RepID=A0ABV6H2X9_9PAST